MRNLLLSAVAALSFVSLAHAQTSKPIVKCGPSLEVVENTLDKLGIKPIWIGQNGEHDYVVLNSTADMQLWIIVQSTAKGACIVAQGRRAMPIFSFGRPEANSPTPRDPEPVPVPDSPRDPSTGEIVPRNLAPSDL